MLVIEQERVNRKMTQKQLAQMLGVTKSTVCDMEKGRCKPSHEKLVKLLALFGMDETKNEVERLFAEAAEQPT